MDANTNVEVVVTTSGTFTLADICSLEETLPSHLRPNASFLAHIGVINVLRNLDGINLEALTPPPPVNTDDIIARAVAGAHAVALE